MDPLSSDAEIYRYAGDESYKLLICPYSNTDMPLLVIPRRFQCPAKKGGTLDDV